MCQGFGLAYQDVRRMVKQLIMKKLINKTIRRRDPIARDLLTPKYRQRIERNRKRDAKSLIPKQYLSSPNY
jgi:hypothetical protein